MRHWLNGHRGSIGLVSGIILCVLWMAVFPMLMLRLDDSGRLVLNYSYSKFTKSKYDTMQLLVLISILPALVIMLCTGLRSIRWRSPGRLIMAAFFLWTVLSAAFGSSAAATTSSGSLVVLEGSGRFEGLYTQLAYMLIFLLFSFTAPRPKAMALAACVPLLVHAVVVALQYAGGNPLKLYPLLYSGGTDYRSIYTNYEFQGLTGNIDMGTGWLSLIAPLLVGAYVVRGGVIGGLSLGIGSIGVMLLLMSGVDAAAFSLGAMVCLLFVAAVCSPELRSRACIAMACLLAVYVLESIIGLPWIDGLKAPWWCYKRDDAFLPKLTGHEAIVFPWDVTWSKLLPLLASMILLALGILWRFRPGKRIPLIFPVAVVLFALVAALLVIQRMDISQEHTGWWQLHELLNGRSDDSFGS